MLTRHIHAAGCVRICSLNKQSLASTIYRQTACTKLIKAPRYCLYEFWCLSFWGLGKYQKFQLLLEQIANMPATD
jgi:hypothetical protein